MITTTCITDMPDERLQLIGVDPWDCVFFDIETTGLRAATSHLYLIGAAYKSAQGWTVIQWMGERPQEEAALLRVFSQFLRPYGTLLHFNGARFDLPYVEEKYGKYGLDSPFTDMHSVDIYKDCKGLRHVFGLQHMNQKSLERFLGLDREDLYDGGQLIKVYYDYVKTGDKELEKMLLLHNCEDVKGMLLLTSLYAYRDLFSCDSLQQGILPLHASADDNSLSIRIDLPYELPVPVRADAASYSLQAEKKTALLTAAVYNGEVLYFFDNYKDYYYLPLEDTAIHKSVGAYMDPKYRQPAKKSNCYTRHAGRFLPQPEPLFPPVYKKAYEDACGWMTLPSDAVEDGAFLRQYAAMLIRNL